MGDAGRPRVRPSVALSTDGKGSRGRWRSRHARVGCCMGSGVWDTMTRTGIMMSDRKKGRLHLVGE